MRVAVAYTVQYYDLVLAGIAVAVATGLVIGSLTAVPLYSAIIVTGLLAVALIGHGLFVNGPVDEPVDLTDTVDALN